MVSKYYLQIRLLCHISESKKERDTDKYLQIHLYKFKHNNFALLEQWWQ